MIDVFQLQFWYKRDARIKWTYRVIPEGSTEFNLILTFVPTFILAKQEANFM